MGLTNFILTVAGVSAVVMLLRSDVKQSVTVLKRNVKHIRHWLEEESSTASKIWRSVDVVHGSADDFDPRAYLRRRWKNSVTLRRNLVEAIVRHLVFRCFSTGLDFAGGGGRRRNLGLSLALIHAARSGMFVTALLELWLDFWEDWERQNYAFAASCRAKQTNIRFHLYPKIWG